jgi:hypothetical protein
MYQQKIDTKSNEGTRMAGFLLQYRASPPPAFEAIELIGTLVILLLLVYTLYSWYSR